METSSPPLQAIDLSAPLYYQVVYTLTNLLPRSLDDTPSVVRIRNLAAIAKVAALLPVNANEADLAAQCIAARAQAEDILRLLRQHEGDIGLVLRLNAQYGSMLRTSLSLHGRLMRVQALRHKREAIEGAANQDAWTLHIAERSMVGIADPRIAPVQTAWPAGGVDPRCGPAAPVATPPASPEGAPAATRHTLPEGAPAATRRTLPEAAPAATRRTLPEAAPAACEDQKIEQAVSEDETNSHDAAFETWLSQKALNPASREPGEADLPEEVDLPEFVREAMSRSLSAKSRSPGRSLPVNGRESPAAADHGRHIGGATAST